MGQKIALKNVSFQALDDNVVVINYDLEGKVKKKFIVELLLYRKENKQYMYKPQNVIGDIGKGRFAGENKKIIWSIDHDEGPDFKVNPFVDDYFFVLRARRKRSFVGFWMLVATGAGGWYLYNEYN